MSQARNMLILSSFLKSLLEKYGLHTIYSNVGTGYPEACNVLGLKHRLHSSLEKSLMERVMEYFKDRSESFDDYYPCSKKEEYNLEHVYNSIELFTSMYNIIK